MARFAWSRSLREDHPARLPRLTPPDLNPEQSDLRELPVAAASGTRTSRWEDPSGSPTTSWAALGQAALTELVVLVGYYRTLADLMHVHDV